MKKLESIVEVEIFDGPHSAENERLRQVIIASGADMGDPRERRFYHLRDGIGRTTVDPAVVDLSSVESNEAAE